MTQVVSSISGLEIYSPSAGFAPTNSGDVSAIASGYQVVSSTATQLYAGTAYLTEVNGATVSASRAGQAANASMANSAYYDGTGRLISALPDSAAVSSIASAYAESAASGKLDSTAFSTVSGDFLTAETVSSITTAQYGPRPTDVGVTAINGFGLVAKSADTAYSAIWASIAGTDGNLRALTSLADSAAVSAIASSYAESAASGKADSSSLSSYALSADVSGVIDTVSSNSASWSGGSLPISGSAGDDTVTYDASSIRFTRYDTAGEPDLRTAELSPDHFYIDYTLDGNDHTSMSLTESMLTFTNPDGDHWVDAYNIDAWNGALFTVAINSAKWGKGVGSATVSAIASSYAESAVSSKQDSSAMSAYALSSNVSGVIDTVSANSATWGAGATLPIIGSAGTDSATYGETSVEFYRYDTAGEPDIRTATLSPDALDITYTVDENDYYSVHINENGVEFSDPDGYYSVTPYDITNWNSAVDTVANNSASWGQGGVDSATVSSIASSYAESAASSKLDTSAQVITSTGSASALSGIWPVITAYFVSSINGSALLPYGYSALSANSANWNSTRISVFNNSANWNSVYNTVSSNSASWSGSTGGGSVTSPSGTIMVTDGNKVEGTNSAVLTASGEAFEQLLSVQNYFFSPAMTQLAAGSVPDTGATLMMSLNYSPGTSVLVILSGQAETGYASASGIIPPAVVSASIPMDGITGNISASAEQWVGLAGALTAKKEGGISVTGVGELAWKSAVDNVTNTVSANSASWGQGGVDSATVSSIASSYAESAVSSKQDSSAMSAYALSSDVSGVIDTVSANSASWTTDLTDYATTAYVDSSVSSKLDSSASSSFYTTANESGYVGSAYVDSALSGKMDSSAIDYTRTGGGTQIYASGTGSSTNQFSAKNDSAGAAIIAGENARLRLWDTAATANLYASSIGGWNAASNLVSSQSANWGGSALALSAGPGVSLTMVGNTLVAGLDETVLYTGTSNSSPIVLSEEITNFEEIQITWEHNFNGTIINKSVFTYNVSSNELFAYGGRLNASGFIWFIAGWTVSSDKQTLTRSQSKYVPITNAVGTPADNNNLYPIKVVGINRTAGV